MKIDIKSIIIGILSTILVFNFFGFNSDKNMGHIIVKSITIQNEKGKNLGEIGYSDKDSISFVRLYGYDKKLTTNIYSSDLGGNIFLKGYDNKSSLGLIGVGVVQIKNSNEKVVALFGNNMVTNSSHLQLYTNTNKGGIDLSNIENNCYLSIKDENGKTRTEIIYDKNQNTSSIKQFNSKNSMIMNISESKDGDGQILLGDRYGDLGWAVDGKKK